MPIIALCHIDRMATWEKGKTEFECPHCGEKYECTYMNFPARDKGSFNCEKCGKEARSWDGCIDYFDFKLVDSKPGNM